MSFFHLISINLSGTNYYLMVTHYSYDRNVCIYSCAYVINQIILGNWNTCFRNIRKNGELVSMLQADKFSPMPKDGNMNRH